MVSCHYCRRLTGGLAMRIGVAAVVVAVVVGGFGWPLGKSEPSDRNLWKRWKSFPIGVHSRRLQY